MTSTFSFGFSGDDIDVDESEINDVVESTQTQGVSAQQESASALPELVRPERHDVEEWIKTLPSQISYNKLSIPSSPPPQDGTSASTTIITLGRREVFDIRTQLMAEDENDSEELISGLEKGDIKPNFYEGGFKTWECAIDLAKLVVSEEERADVLGLGNDAGESHDVHVIELGAGTAMPSLALFAQLLSRPVSTTPSRRRYHFTFADYNSIVLRLVTLPNILLTWKFNARPSQAAGISEGSVSEEAQGQNRSQSQGQEEDEGELDIDRQLLESFKADLERRDISIGFVSGAWSRPFVDFVLQSRDPINSDKGCKALILASETIYSPSSLKAFSETLLALLRATAGRSSRALVAAKRVYFGVGGGVDEFLAILREMAGEKVDVRQKMEVKTEGVGRVVLEIRATGEQ
ncbi:hypothetical protein VTN00DRAFT_2816 [Thermoascus crustaceus]|uniref:uncharacterized protein n=1 Tax=Thermoascus crustaceus TaxID=5088 RepID=UPI003742BAF1